MSQRRKSPLLYRWELPLAALLMGAALLVAVWSSYRSVDRASATLTRGQGDLLAHAIREHLHELAAAPTDADLARLLREYASDGLRYVAVRRRFGEFVASAGTAVAAPGPFHEPRGGELRIEPFESRAGERARAEFRGGLRGRGGERFGPRGGVSIAIEFEPLRAAELRAAAVRSLSIGVAAALVLIAGACWLVRFILLRQASERERERERHLASLGQLSAVLAHEIRNPLASLKGNAQLLLESLPEGERTHAKAERVVSEAVRLETLTNDLLEFARSGGLRRAVADPRALLRESAAAVAADITVDDSAAPGEWPLDVVRMRQVLTNLLENAHVAGPPVVASARSEDGRLVFEVQDAGPGVAESDRERIFEPFFTRRTQGTGLGLAVAKHVVELHGGTLSVHDAPAGGALFRVALPAA